MRKPRIRCSSLDRLINCPGSRTLEEIVERPGDTGVTWEGNAIHYEVAWRLVNELGASQPDGGLQRPALPPNYKIPSSSSWIVAWCFRIVKESVPADWVLEVESELEWEFDRFILTGHEDVAATSADGKHGRDKDWKAGRIPVLPAELNWQVSGYAALRYLIYCLDTLELEICQPWNDEDEGFERRSVVRLDAGQLAANVAALEARINSALDRADELETGMSQCKYCVGLSCPALLALRDSMKMRLTPEYLAGLRAKPDDATLADLVVACRTLGKPMEDAEKMLKLRLKTVGSVTGSAGTVITLKSENAGFKVVNAVGMFQWLKTLLTEEQMAPALSYPGGRIKDQLAEALDINKGGNEPVTAKSVFEGGAAPFIKATKKEILVFQ